MIGDSEKGRYSSPEGSALWEYFAAISCALLVFCVGCMTGWISPTTSILMSPDSPIPLTSSEASTLAACLTLGYSLAPTLVMVMADKLGRKNSLLAAGIPAIVSWGMVAVAREIIVLFVARFIGGLSVGLLLGIPPLYLGEIASVRLRGAIGMVCGTMINAGILFMFVIVPYLTMQSAACLCTSVAILAVVSVWFIPESPYFLVMSGRIEEAEGALEKLRGKIDVAEELDLIKLTVTQKGNATSDRTDADERGTPRESGAFRQLFTIPGNRKALLVSLMFMLALQFGGYISIVIYTQIIFERMNTGVSAHVCTMVVATIQLASNILTVFVIDRLGRRPLICISGVTSGACVLVVGVYFYLMEYTEVDVTPYATIALGAVFADIVVLNVGLAPLQMVVQSEILATGVKELVTCISGVSGGVLGTIGAKSYLTLAETWNLGHSVPFLCFPVITWISTALILKALPETKGKTLLEIQRDLNN